MTRINNLLRVATVVAAAFLLAACNKPVQTHEPVFVYDDSGIVRRVNPEEKNVYLVFTAHYSENDQGYFENFDGLVPVLNTLKEKGVKGSFFPTGVCFAQPQYEEPIRRIIDEGHYLSAHSYAHLVLCENGQTLVTADSLAKDFAKMEAQLARFGLEKKQYYWMIPPYETCNAESRQNIENLGYKLLNPSAGPLFGLDWTTPDMDSYTTIDQMLDRLWEMEETEGLNGLILLIHAMNYPEKQEVERPYNHLGEIIDTLRARGYGFRTFNDVVADEAALAPKTGRVEKSLAALHDPASKYVMVVAHRSDWRNNPENSLPAIESCIRMGVDMIELDLKQTKDSVLVLSHDHTLNRCTTGNGRISDYTYDQILSLSLKSSQGEPCPGIKMPTLRQALEACKDRILVNVDQGYEYYDRVLAMAEELGVTDQILIKSGQPWPEVKEKLASHPRNLLYMPIISGAQDGESPLFQGYVSDPKPQLAYELCFTDLNDNAKGVAAKILDSGAKLWVNTLWASLCGGYEDNAAFAADDPGTVYGPILDLGTSIIQTDRPEFLIGYLESLGRH